MTRMRILPALVALALVAAAGAAIAKDDDDDRGKGKKAEYRKHGDKWVLKNDDITLWFHQTGSGKAKPMLKVFHTDADGNVSGYKFRIDRLCEVDKNATSCEDAFAKMNLGKAGNWNTEIVNDGGGNVTIRMLLTDAQGIVGLTFHLRDDTPYAKFDVDVANWRWTGTTGALGVSDHVLLLEMKYQERFRGAGIQEDGDDDEDEEPTVAAPGGYISWAPNATAVDALGVSHTLNVSAHHKSGEDDEEDDDDDASGRIALRFDGLGGYKTLVYDPTLGIATAGHGSAPDLGIPAAGAVAAVAAVSVAATAAARRLR